MENKPEISLIICTRNRDDLIEGALNSAVNQTLNHDKFEVLVLDQSNNNKTLKILEKYPDFIYKKLNSQGLSISRNEGIKHSNGNILVFVDDDVLFEANYLENILTFFKESELKPDFIGGKTHIKYCSEKPDWIDGPLLGILAYSDYGDEALMYDSHPKHVPYGCNMAVKRECAEKINGFSNIISKIDPRMTENEDVIFGNKLRDLGYNTVYCPTMRVLHQMPDSRLNYNYFKKRYNSQGGSDAYIYYLLKLYSLQDIPNKILIHLTRLIESLLLRYLKKTPKEKYYQKLRLYYNSGYIRSLIHILLNKEKFNENS